MDATQSIADVPPCRSSSPRRRCRKRVESNQGCKKGATGDTDNSAEIQQCAGTQSGAGGISTSAAAALPGCPNRSPGVVDEVGVAVDSGSIQARCSVKAIHDIISRFGDRKRKLVEKIGFGGLLKFPSIRSTNRRFSAWLMRMVDIKQSCLTLPDGSSLKFYSRDVGLVFGIPAAGKKVSEAGQLNNMRKGKMKLKCWPLSGKDERSIKAVEELVNTTYHGEMTPEQEDAFKVAFVVFVMSTLFVPGAKHDYVHVDYWAALANPSTIQEFDWAAYVHKRLITSAGKYKTDIVTGSKTPNITGCDIFLQIFYLDNMEIKEWAMDHSVKPRISCFSYDRIQNMIAADTYERNGVKSTSVFGKSKVRPREQSCYTWAQTIIDHPLDGEREAQIILWDAVIRMATILRVPLEAAGPLFLAATDLNQQDQSSSPRTGIECINILLQIMEPFVKGFNYNFDLRQRPESAQCNDGELDVAEHLCSYCHGTRYTIVRGECKCKKRTYGDARSASISVGSVNLNMTSTNLGCTDALHPKRARVAARDSSDDVMWMTGEARIADVDFSVIKSMSKIRERNRLDLNTSPLETQEFQDVSISEEEHRAGSARSPWQLGGLWHYNSLSPDILPAVTARVPIIMPHIVGYSPKYIEVMSEAAQDQRLGICEMEMDMFDAIIRCFRKSDDTLYHMEGRLRWRHFFESDILAAIIAGWFDIDNPCVRNQFTGSHLTYDIFNCTMLYFPVILHERWVCFTWNLVENELVVFDPSRMNIPGFSRHSIYTHVADMLKGTLSSVIQVLFPGWEHDLRAASITPFHWRYAGMPRSNRAGVLCAYFCQCFDGKKLIPELEREHIDRIAEKLFSDVSAIQGGS